MKAFKNNKTFGYGRITDLNACVGQNGFNDIESYEFGYKEAVIILINHLKKDSSYVDTIIYPLAFTARHCIELFLKKTVTILECINDICNSKIVNLKIKKTHNIEVLWGYFKNISKIDKRFTKLIIDLDEYIIDYCEVDLTGETFRYPYDKENKHHLDEYSCFNIINLEKRFKESIVLLERITFYAKFILEEYGQKTFIHGVCREDIEKISFDLPKKETWVHPGFKEIKKSIMEKYDIGSRALSDVINLIQSHKEFSFNIGIPLPVKEINLVEYKRFKETFTDYHKNAAQQKDYFKYKQQVTEYMVESLSNDAIYSIRTFWEIGFHKLYSEQYEPLMQHFKIEKDVYDILYMEIIGMGRSVERIEAGIKICGQNHLLES